MSVSLVVVFLFFHVVVGKKVSVTVENGELQGFTGPWPSEDVRSFLGVPFAKAPVGKLRFFPPEPYTEVWSKPWEATKLPPSCMQHNVAIAGGPYSEDCLYLNVWTPVADKITELLPVMVFLYGGGYSHGGTEFQLYDGRHILNRAQKPVIIVTLNYRVGAFGFMGSKEMQAKSKDGSTGNAGLQDQRMAAHWVKRNIEAFGGNSSRITIWGESAGAGSISNHLVMPRSKGMFHQAIVESGPISHWVAHNFTATQSFYDKVMAHVNCTTLDCLQQAPAKSIMNTPDIKFPGYFLSWAPTIDGVELKENPQVLAKQGRFANRVPVLIGTNRDEGTLLSRKYGISTSTTVAQFKEFVEHSFPGPDVDPLFALYALDKYPDPQPYWAAAAIVTDNGMTCPAQRTSEWLTDANLPVFQYFYTHELEVLKLFYPELGVFHGSELIMIWDIKYYTYDGITVPLPLTDGERDLQSTFINLWTNFVWTGNPNEGPSQPPASLTWPQWDNKSQQSFQIDEELGVIAFNRLKYCELSNKYYRPV